VATLFAPRREDLTAVLGAHALEESVNALASTVMRLKGPLHGTGAPNEMGKRKALYCIGLKYPTSRVKRGMRMVLKLSTAVDRAVDKPWQERGSNPFATGVPAA
jgi:hypothetical protein